jgi:hypothetical protein
MALSLRGTVVVLFSTFSKTKRSSEGTQRRLPQLKGSLYLEKVLEVG